MKIMFAKFVQLWSLELVSFAVGEIEHGLACKNKPIIEEMPGTLSCLSELILRWDAECFEDRAHPSTHKMMGSSFGRILLSKNPIPRVVRNQ